MKTSMAKWMIAILLAGMITSCTNGAQSEPPVPLPDGAETTAGRHPSGPEQAFPDDLPRDSTIEEQLARKEQFWDWAKANGRIHPASGEETKGTDLVIADKKITLPDDAYVKAYIVAVIPSGQGDDVSRHLPYYVIARGNSTIAISANTGYVLNLNLDASDHKPFDFLKEAVNGYLDGVSRLE